MGHCLVKYLKTMISSDGFETVEVSPSSFSQIWSARVRMFSEQSSKRSEACESYSVWIDKTSLDIPQFTFHAIIPFRTSPINKIKKMVHINYVAIIARPMSAHSEHWLSTGTFCWLLCSDLIKCHWLQIHNNEAWERCACYGSGYYTSIILKQMAFHRQAMFDSKRKLIGSKLKFFDTEQKAKLW